VVFRWSLEEAGPEKFVENKSIVAREDYISSVATTAVCFENGFDMDMSKGWGYVRSDASDLMLATLIVTNDITRPLLCPPITCYARA
jgi:hypothetical protein